MATEELASQALMQNVVFSDGRRALLRQCGCIDSSHHVPFELSCEHGTHKALHVCSPWVHRLLNALTIKMQGLPNASNVQMLSVMRLIPMHCGVAHLRGHAKQSRHMLRRLRSRNECSSNFGSNSECRGAAAAAVCSHHRLHLQLKSRLHQQLQSHINQKEKHDQREELLLAARTVDFVILCI